MRFYNNRISEVTSKKVTVALEVICLLILLALFNCESGNTTKTSTTTRSCSLPFEGFGIFLGSVVHFSNSPPGTVQKVIEKVYTDLGIRHFRTSIESDFSKENDTYDISCSSSYTCTWNEVQEAISHYRDNISLIASIWSPPHYMKNIVFDTLIEEYELPYLYFIKNITLLMKQKYNLTVEKVSPINEPENLFASWEHTNMGPHQLCRMIKSFNTSLVSLCPENSYFWMTELYSNYTDNSTGVDCQSSCDVYATHAYTLNINFFSPNHLLAYYDSGRYERKTDKPIWMTEVSSTFPVADLYQMQEGLDFAKNIINFVRSTCVQRYYFWYAFTRGYSGESIIWGYDQTTGVFVLPKKYFVYKHFTLASFGGPKMVSECGFDIDPHLNQDNDSGFDTNFNTSTEDDDGVDCIQFGKKNVVIVNRNLIHFSLEGFECKTIFCCTTSEFDWFCSGSNGDDKILPKRAVCSCELEIDQNNNDEGEIGRIFIIANSTIFSNEVPQR